MRRGLRDETLVPGCNDLYRIDLLQAGDGPPPAGCATPRRRPISARSSGIWPRHAGRLNNLGTSVWQQGRVQEAEEYYRRALAEAPNDFGVLNNLGNALWEQSRPVEAVDFYRRALRLQPDAAETQMNLGVALSDLGEFDEAIALARVVLAAPARFARGARQPRDDAGPARPVGRGDGLVRAGAGDPAGLPRGPPESGRSSGWRTAITSGDGPSTSGGCAAAITGECPSARPAWRGEDIAGRTILLHAEQGLGDVVHFIRFAAAVKRRGARVIAACPDSLMRLVARCPGVDAVQDWYAPVPECDVHAPLMSLPAILGTTLAIVPGECPVPLRRRRDRRPLAARSSSGAWRRPIPETTSRAPDGRRTFRIGDRLAGEPAPSQRSPAFLPARSLRPSRRAARASAWSACRRGRGSNSSTDLARPIPGRRAPGLRAGRARTAATSSTRRPS